MEFDFIKRWVLDNLVSLGFIFQTWYYHKNNAIKIKRTFKKFQTRFDNSIIGKKGSVLPMVRVRSDD